jgi:hypothetical protein
VIELAVERMTHTLRGGWRLTSSRPAVLRKLPPRSQQFRGGSERKPFAFEKFIRAILAVAFDQFGL